MLSNNALTNDFTALRHLLIPLQWVGLVLLASPLCAQEYHFQHYDIFSGLAQSQVSDIEQDSEGYMWFSTRGGGISRFDGQHFTTFRKEDQLPANNILTLEIDPKGLLYIGTPFGLSVYNGKTTLPIRNSIDPFFNVKSLINDKQGNIYAIYNSSQIGRVVGNKLVTLPKIGAQRPTFYSDMSVDKQGRLMVSTFAGEIFEIKDTILVCRYRLPQGISLSSLLFDSKDSLWLGTQKGVFKTSHQKETLSLSFLRSVTSERVVEMAESRDGAVWMGLLEGALRYKQGQLNLFNAQNGFSNAAVVRLAEDQEGNMWFSTDGEGIYKFTNPQFRRLTAQSGLKSNSVLSMALSKDQKLWISYFDGNADIWDARHQKLTSLPDYLRNQDINYIALDNENNIWVSLRSSILYKISPQQIPTKYELKSRNASKITQVLHMTAGQGDELWLSTTDGIVLYSRGSFRHFSKKDGLKSNFIRRVLLHQKNEVIVSSPSGLNIVRNGQVMDFEYDAQMASYKALSMAKRPDGLLAFGSFEDGLIIFDPKTRQKRAITVKDHLCSNLIYNVLFDQEGQLWVGTERGIDCVRFDGHLRPISIRHFDQMDGFLAQETNANTALLTSEGQVWMGTIMGVAMHEKNPQSSLKKGLKVHFTKVEIPFDTTDLSLYAKTKNRWHDVYQGLQLPHDKNHLKIDFLAIDHTYPTRIKYQHYLEGTDKKWLGPTAQNTLDFTNLSPGEYRLHLRASLDGQTWGPTATLPFTIVTPFYQRGWVIALGLLLLGMTGIMAQRMYIKSRTRRILKYEKLKQEAEANIRAQIAQDFHDELGNRLAAIKMQSNVLKMLHGRDDTPQAKIIQEIEKHVSQLFRDTKDFIWSIDPDSNVAQEMALYIKDFIENFLNNSPIHFHSNIVGMDNNAVVTLPTGWSMQVIMIFKEALTNALKHAHCHNIYFNVTIRDNEVSFELKDDGIGLDTPTPGYHKGLQGMRQRAAKIGAELTITSIIPHGTRVLLCTKPKTDNQTNHTANFENNYDHEHYYQNHYH